MEKKITKREVINSMLADENVKANAVWVEYLANELRLLDKKSTNRKPTKVQKENVSLKDTIVEVLADSGKAMTVTEILASGAFESSISSQKISALLKQLVEVDNKVIKTTEKKVSRFSVVSDEVEGE
jgi:hypothetical protein